MLGVGAASRSGGPRGGAAPGRDGGRRRRQSSTAAVRPDALETELVPLLGVEDALHAEATMAMRGAPLYVRTYWVVQPPRSSNFFFSSRAPVCVLRLRGEFLASSHSCRNCPRSYEGQSGIGEGRIFVS